MYYSQENRCYITNIYPAYLTFETNRNVFQQAYNQFFLNPVRDLDSILNMIVEDIYTDYNSMAAHTDFCNEDVLVIRIKPQEISFEFTILKFRQDINNVIVMLLNLTRTNNAESCTFKLEINPSEINNVYTTNNSYVFPSTPPRNYWVNTYNAFYNFSRISGQPLEGKLYDSLFSSIRNSQAVPYVNNCIYYRDCNNYIFKCYAYRDLVIVYEYVEN